jgi:hypothetical protein
VSSNSCFTRPGGADAPAIKRGGLQRRAREEASPGASRIRVIYARIEWRRIFEDEADVHARRH